MRFLKLIMIGLQRMGCKRGLVQSRVQWCRDKHEQDNGHLSAGWWAGLWSKAAPFPLAFSLLANNPITLGCREELGPRPILLVTELWALLGEVPYNSCPTEPHFLIPGFCFNNAGYLVQYTICIEYRLHTQICYHLFFTAPSHPRDTPSRIKRVQADVHNCAQFWTNSAGWVMSSKLTLQRYLPPPSLTLSPPLL